VNASLPTYDDIVKKYQEFRSRDFMRGRVVSECAEWVLGVNVARHITKITMPYAVDRSPYTEGDEITDERLLRRADKLLDVPIVYDEQDKYRFELRMKANEYGDFFNIPSSIWQKYLDQQMLYGHHLAHWLPPYQRTIPITKGFVTMPKTLKGDSLKFTMNLGTMRGITVEVEDNDGFVRIMKTSDVVGEDNKLLIEMTAEDFQRFRRLIEAADWRVQDFIHED
jgi:hypothetical protein